MSVEVYELAPPHPAEFERERAVRTSGALHAIDAPELVAIVERARRTLRTSMAAISIIYHDTQYLIAAAGLPGGPYSRHTSFCGHVIAGRERLICVPDTHQDARFASNPSVTGGLRVRSYAGVKLLGAQAMPLGVLCVFDPKPNWNLVSAAYGALVPLADQAATQLDRLARPPVAPIAVIAPVAAGTDHLAA